MVIKISIGSPPCNLFPVRTVSPPRFENLARRTGISTGEFQRRPKFQTRSLPCFHFSAIQLALYCSFPILAEETIFESFHVFIGAPQALLATQPPRPGARISVDESDSSDSDGEFQPTKREFTMFSSMRSGRIADTIQIPDTLPPPRGQQQGHFNPQQTCKGGPCHPHSDTWQHHHRSGRHDV